MILQSEVDKLNQHKGLKIFLIVITALLIAVVLYTVIRVNKEGAVTPGASDLTGDIENNKERLPESFPIPERVDFEAVTPTDFPIDIPLEKEAKFEQSYSLTYEGQKQLTIVFPTTKPIKENYILYTDFLTSDTWSIVNTYEGETIASLYAMKEHNDINVTITSERVSISVLNSTPVPIVQSPQPTKTVFENEVPTDFPTNIPLEEGAELTQSFSLDYDEGQKQLTVAFLSTKTVKENSTLYTDFLTKDGWTVPDTFAGDVAPPSYEDAPVSVLYGRKGDSGIIITIGLTSDTTKSQVSIVLNK